VLVQWGFAGGGSEWGGQQLEVVGRRSCFGAGGARPWDAVYQLRRVPYVRARGRIDQVDGVSSICLQNSEIWSMQVPKLPR
jgi:hypothetical protein